MNDITRTETHRTLRTLADNENRDPITGTPGSHPVGTGIGAAVGGAAAGAALTGAAATGAIAGAAAGPVGIAVGAAVGAIVGGLAGKGVAEAIAPTSEDAYWRENFRSCPYIGAGASFDDYGPAFGLGVAGYNKYRGRSFDEIESDLSRDWASTRGTSSLGWDRAKSASRDAWDRASRSV